MKIAIAHINSAAVEPLNRCIKAIDSTIDATILLNEQPLHEINKLGSVGPRPTQEFAQLLFGIDPSQYDGILVGCSMFSAKADLFSPFFDIPVVGIDQAMLNYVATHYQHVGVLATNATAGAMSSEQIKVLGNAHDVEVTTEIVQEANGYSRTGDMDSYTNSIWKAANRLMTQGVETIVLAQVSMTVTEGRLQSLNIPVISSPKLGLEELTRKIQANN